MLDAFQVCLREGHLEQMFHMFAYLKKYERLVVVLDHTEPELSEDGFQEVDWQEYDPNAREAIRPNMPEVNGAYLVDL
jgi:hypothetical protein